MNASSDMCSFLFIRHGETIANRMQVASGGDSESALTEFGRNQIFQATDVLRQIGEAPDTIICSTNQRSIETAEILCEAFKGQITSFPLLRERKLGVWNNQSSDVVNPLLMAGETPENGESKDEFRSRFLLGLNQVHDLLLNHRSIIVGSRGTARILLEMADDDDAANFPNGRMLRVSLVQSDQFELAGIDYIG
ncbi:MAG: phosphoglycerate mutase family protein [Acidiferrobacterales bacterium]|nr:phosphoglycerate mutase family protein [Acidiferrobacterales bacterium]